MQNDQPRWYHISKKIKVIGTTTDFFLDISVKDYDKLRKFNGVRPITYFFSKGEILCGAKANTGSNHPTHMYTLYFKNEEDKLKFLLKYL